MCVPRYTEKIRHAYKSKHNLKHENQVILLMITDGKKWHYLAVKSLPALLRGITSNNNGEFYCLNCFHAYTTKNRLEKHKKVCENHDHYCVEMPNEDNKILKYNYDEKSIKAPFVIYADLECLPEKINTCHNDPEKSSTTKINKHTVFGYSLSTCNSFGAKVDKPDCYRGKDCLKKFIKDFKKRVIRIINYSLSISTDVSNEKYHKVRDHCHYTGKYRGAAHNICNLTYKIPKEIPVILHNGSTYDYHLILKELAKEFEGPFECLGENTEKYITFSVPLDNGKTITYKMKFMDSYRFMPSSLSSLADNLSGGLHSENCADCKSHLDYMSIKDDKLIFRCFECKRNYEKEFNKELIKRFANMYEFCNKDINKFILLLRKGVYSYEYMDNWERFDETSLHDKKSFLQQLKYGRYYRC